MAMTMTDEEYAALTEQIRSDLDIDLDAYKAQQMQRRLSTFIRNHAPSVAEFIELLDGDQALLAELRDTITINVSEFLRDAHQFERLRDEVLPPILAAHSRISIWSAACSRGQEPYSLAMLLQGLGVRRRARILATDLDRDALRLARAGGPYREEDLRNLSAEQRGKFINEEDAGPFVERETRSMVTFKEHNLLRDDFGSGFHLIVCRNVLIYFSPEVKSTIINGFKEALAPGGVLFIGGSEALLSGDREGFHSVGGNFYQKTDVPVARAA